MFRSVLKIAAACALTFTRLDVVARGNLYRHVPFVVAYHRVVQRLDAGDGFALPAMEISVGMLEKHLDWLGRHFQVVSLDDLPTNLEQRPSSKPMAAVTFDDGYSDVFHHGFPLLKRKGIPAGIFVVTDLVGSSEPPVHERMHALLVEAWSRWASPRKELADLLWAAKVGSSLREVLPKAVQDPFSATQFLLRTFSHDEVQRLIDGLQLEADTVRTSPLALTWEMLSTMRDAGMTIGSHSKSHPFLANESNERVQYEAAASRRALEQRLGIEVTSFAYPGGSFNASVVRAVDAAGYRLGFTICRHRIPQYPMLTIPRRMLWERSCLDPRGRFSQAIMSCHAARAFDWTSSCGRGHGLNS